MSARGMHGASAGLTGEGRRAFVAARAQRDPAIRAAKAALSARFEAVGEAGAPDAPSTFALLYESADARLCLFQTEDGHLCAVDASKFA